MPVKKGQRIGKAGTEFVRASIPSDLLAAVDTLALIKSKKRPEVVADLIRKGYDAVLKENPALQGFTDALRKAREE